MSGIETPGLPALVSATGLETASFDTNAASGVAPQTAKVSTLQLGAGATQFSVPLTGFSITVAAGTSAIVLDPAGTLATGTIVLPAATALVDGQTLRIVSSQTVTALTLTPGSGTTVAQSPTALTVSATVSYGYELIYVLSQTKWYRAQ